MAPWVVNYLRKGGKSVKKPIITHAKQLNAKEMFNVDFIKDLLNDEFLFSLSIHLCLQFSSIQLFFFLRVPLHEILFPFFLLVNGIIYFVNFFKWQSLTYFIFILNHWWFNKEFVHTADELLQLQLDFLLIFCLLRLVGNLPESHVLDENLLNWEL